jgi:hypothetical protein
MSTAEIKAAWGNPTAIAPGDVAGIDEVWAYHDPNTAHGNAVWMLRFADGSLHKVEKLIGMARTSSNQTTDEYTSEQSAAETIAKP